MIHEESHPVIKWLLFLLMGADKEIAEEVERLKDKDNTLQRVFDEWDKISSDPAVVAEYISRKKFAKDLEVKMLNARDEQEIRELE